eukprot:TRINITY_DN9116_c0_g1_i1.p1 TRINITY_DN9116_c0_g1~~TRINITY_DN9116_c0_g1_i1.p1  ORF type:complete len:225 (-),score=50.71 TRINITY_DN9116_c0_g1_i1:103-720(-)
MEAAHGARRNDADEAMEAAHDDGARRHRRVDRDHRQCRHPAAMPKTPPRIRGSRMVDSDEETITMTFSDDGQFMPYTTFSFKDPVPVPSASAQVPVPVPSASQVPEPVPSAASQVPVPGQSGPSAMPSASQASQVMFQACSIADLTDSQIDILSRAVRSSPSASSSDSYPNPSYFCVQCGRSELELKEKLDANPALRRCIDCTWK